MSFRVSRVLGGRLPEVMTSDRPGSGRGRSPAPGTCVPVTALTAPRGGTPPAPRESHVRRPPGRVYVGLHTGEGSERTAASPAGRAQVCQPARGWKPPPAFWRGLCPPWASPCPGRPGSGLPPPRGDPARRGRDGLWEGGVRGGKSGSARDPCVAWGGLAEHRGTPGTGPPARAAGWAGRGEGARGGRAGEQAGDLGSGHFAKRRRRLLSRAPVWSRRVWDIGRDGWELCVGVRGGVHPGLGFQLWKG